MSDDRVGAGRGPYRVDPQLRGQFRDPVETGPSGRFGRSGTGRQEVRLRIVIGNADRSGHPPVPSRAPCAASVASASITGAPVAGRGLQNGQGAADQSARAERRGHGQLRSPSRVPGGRQGRGGSQRRGALGRPSRSQAARHGEDDRPAAPLPTVPCEPKASPLRPAPAPPRPRPPAVPAPPPTSPVAPLPSAALVPPELPPPPPVVAVKLLPPPLRCVPFVEPVPAVPPVTVKV